MRISVKCLWAVVLLALATLPLQSYADDWWLFTSNDYEHRGRKIVLGTEEIGGSYTVPCQQSVSNVVWGPSAYDAVSYGVAQDWDGDYVWVSTKIDLANTIIYSAVYFDISTEEIDKYSYDDEDYEPYSSFSPVDVLGNYPYNVLSIKETGVGDDGIIVSQDEDDVENVLVEQDEPYQLEWLDGEYFLATLAGEQDLILSKKDRAYPLSFALDTIAAGQRPESVAVAEIVWPYIQNNTCHSEGGYSADYAVYVGDYDADELLFYSVDVSSEDIQEEGGLYGALSLTETGPSYCRPSHVKFVPPNTVYVLCQTRNSILKISTGVDPCSAEDVDDELTLKSSVSG